MNRWMQMVVVLLAAAAMTGCASKRKNQDEMAINDANSSYGTDGVQSSGLGDDSGYGDTIHKSTRTASNGRVYYFDFDSNVVHANDKPAIVANAEKLSSKPHAKVMVEGHTDPRGSREYNIGLGERRAKAVAQIMTANGASKRQIRVVSYGAEKLAASGHTEQDYQLDRRSSLVYLQE